jgi:hypothetical protein
MCQSTAAYEQHLLGIDRSVYLRMLAEKYSRHCVRVERCKFPGTDHHRYIAINSVLLGFMPKEP